MISLGHRQPEELWRAMRDWRHYRAVCNAFRVYDRPVTLLRDYITGAGDYPRSVQLRLGRNRHHVQLFSPDDLITVNESEDPSLVLPSPGHFITSFPLSVVPCM